MKKKNILVFLIMIVCTGMVYVGCNSQTKDMTESTNRNLPGDNNVEVLPVDEQTEENFDDTDKEQAVRPAGTQMEGLNEDLQQKANEILEKADDLVEEMKEGN